VAQTIHQLSNRRDRAFVIVNCAAIPEALLESEMFGHERGAFTGAIEQRHGCFELADKGTLFLDEIAEISPGFNSSCCGRCKSGRSDASAATRSGASISV